MHKKTKLVHDTNTSKITTGEWSASAMYDKHADKFHLHKTAK